MGMRYSSISNAALASLLSVCAGPTKTSHVPRPGAFHAYSATQGNVTGSSLAIEQEPAGQRLAGVTHFADGSCLAEEATLDNDGRMLHAEYTLSRADSQTRVVLDPRAGLVEMHGPGFATNMRVPSDLPWVWTPLLNPAANSGALSTPLAAVVTVYGARANRAVRAIDLGARQSHSWPSEQLLVKDVDQTDLVVVGDDVVSLDNGVPRQWHVWAFDQDLESREADGLLHTLAAFACLPVTASAT